MGSAKRSSADPKVDFPDPVRPIRPVFGSIGKQQNRQPRLGSSQTPQSMARTDLLLRFDVEADPLEHRRKLWRVRDHQILDRDLIEQKIRGRR